jgi:hypothetical protein
MADDVDDQWDHQPTIEQATEALIAPIAAARLALPRGDGAHEAEQALLALCEDAKRLIHQQCRRIEQRRDSRSRRSWRRVLSEEQKQEAALKQQVIDAGYRSMAAKLHPDIGGSHDAMIRLNQVRDALKQR